MSNVSRNNSVVLGLLVWLLLIALPCSVTAEDKYSEPGKFSLGLSAGFSPILSGDAGSSQNAPDYDDLFKIGHGLALEAEYRVCDYASLVAGIGYEEFSGRSYQGLDFDDLEIIPVYVGGKFHIPVDYPIKPYLLAHVGAAHFSSVEVSWHSLSANYWDSSWVFMGDIGMGLNYNVDNWNFYGSVKFRYMGAPDNNLKAADADSSWTAPMYLGVSYSF